MVDQLLIAFNDSLPLWKGKLCCVLKRENHYLASGPGTSFSRWRTESEPHICCWKHYSQNLVLHRVVVMIWSDGRKKTLSLFMWIWDESNCELKPFLEMQRYSCSSLEFVYKNIWSWGKEKQHRVVSYFFFSLVRLVCCFAAESC